MEKINTLLNNSQSILNNMEKEDEESIHAIKENQSRLEKIMMELDEQSIYEKYTQTHAIILKSAQEFLHTNHEIYKLQPLFYYLTKDNFHIEDNTLKLSIQDKEVILDHDSNNIEIHDEFHLENDALFEKENIPLLIKEMAREKDLHRLHLLEDYVRSLIRQAEEDI